jgi:hypothetical protein
MQLLPIGLRFAFRALLPSYIPTLWERAPYFRTYDAQMASRREEVRDSLLYSEAI